MHLHLPHAASGNDPTRPEDAPSSAALPDQHAPGRAPEQTPGQTPRQTPGQTPRTARLIALVVLAVTGLATVLGMWALWPDFERAHVVVTHASAGSDQVTFEQGEILALDDRCETEDPAVPIGDLGGSCLRATVGILSGPDSGRTTSLELRDALAESGVTVGDRIELSAFQSGFVDDASGLSQEYAVSGIERGTAILVLAAVFVIVLAVVGRLRGLLALCALTLSGAILVGFVLPALISGQPGLPVGVVASVAIMIPTLYFVHGVTLRTTSALLGTLAGVAVMALLSWVAVSATRLSGVGDEASSSLAILAGDLDYRGILSCAVLIAGLGVLNDVTISQSSAVWELRAAAPTMPRSDLFRAAMRIGKDHIASTVYTVFFAYVGAALSTLLLIYLTNRNALGLLTLEDFATEAVRTLCGSIGLILAVPITTWIATWFAPAAQQRHESWASHRPGAGTPPHGES